MTRITVLLPVCNGEKHLEEAIQSIIRQDFDDWNLLIINEYESDDRSADIARSYEKRDRRIKLVQNERKYGLAESLNRGMRMANGEYIARIDADDTSLPSRFSKQLKFMDNHPDIAVCGTWQKHIGEENWIHEPPAEQKMCHAYLLFFCHLCHSTLMLRKRFFLENNLFYNPDFFAEDFELWSRVTSVGNIANIPEVLGTYRHSKQNITAAKRNQMNNETGHIAAASIKRNLSLSIPDNQHFLFNNWRNPIFGLKRGKRLIQLKIILEEIWNANERAGFYDKDALLTAINSKWQWAKYNSDWMKQENANSFDEVFRARHNGVFIENIKRFLNNNPTFSGRCKKVIQAAAKYLHSGGSNVR